MAEGPTGIEEHQRKLAAISQNAKDALTQDAGEIPDKPE